MRWSPSVWWNELRWLHSLMHSPFLSLQQQGEEEGSTEGKLLSFCFSFNDTKHLPWYSCSVQRILYIYKVQSKYPAWQRVASNPVRSLVVIIVCDCGTVSDCATDYCPLLWKNAGELARTATSSLQALFPALLQNTRAHPHSAHLCPCGYTQLFTSAVKKNCFIFYWDSLNHIQGFKWHFLKKDCSHDWSN